MKDYTTYFYTIHNETEKCVSLTRVGSWLNQLFKLLFPVDLDIQFESEESFKRHIEKLQTELNSIVECNATISFEEVTERFFEQLPAIREVLNTDVEAIYNGDPAAKSEAEVVRCYPGIFAIAAYRIAHALVQLGVKIVPRMITEYAHSKTGIDIHPEAKIKPYFFIDHGTGVVIGATSEIGQNVKIYQGVTLGGLSVRKADADVKRHPTIEDNVVIYAGATILGGKTVIGKNSIIGGNTFITKSIAPNSKIYHSPTNSNNK